MLAVEESIVRGNRPQSPNARKSTEVSAWQLGIDRYLATLPADLKHTFRAPASAEECLQLLQNVKTRNRKFDRVVNLLQPLIEPLKTFEASVDVLVQTYSSIASPIWGPLRVLITIASNRLSTLTHVATLIERLVEPLKRFHNYEITFLENTSLRQAIGNLYCDLIEFCTRLVAHESKSPLRKTFASFDKDVAEITDNIRFHWAEVDLNANAANLSEAKVARIKVDVHRAEEFQRDVNRWLAPATIEDDLQRLSNVCAPSSCGWILETEAMCRFRDCKDASSLWLSSWPGGGKSVAASFLVKHLREHSPTPVLYFFCQATNAEKSFATSVLRTLVWQLLQIEPALCEVLAPLYNRCGRQIADSEVLVFELFETVMRNHTQQEVCIIIDALDECHDTSTLLSAMINAQQLSKAGIKLLLTSRGNPDVAEQLKFCNETILLHSNTTSLNRYIKDRIDALGLPITSTQREEVRSTIENGSNGLWLFAKLMIDEISKASSVDEIHQQVQTVPHGLAQLYNTILQEREKQFSKMQLAMAQQVFLWARMNEYIPQDLWKTHVGNGLDDEVIDIIFQYLTKSKSEVFKPIELIQRLCSPLLSTRLVHEDHLVLFINGKPIHCTNFVVEFFHQTAEQYLHWCSDAPSSQIPRTMQPRRMADLHRAACAVWYFGESQHFQHVLHHLQERPRSSFENGWIEMTCALWQGLSLQRLRRDLVPKELDEAHDLVDTIVSFLTTERCLGFVEASLILHYSGQCDLLARNTEATSDTSSLTPTSSRGRLDVLDALIEGCNLFKADLQYGLTRFPATSQVADEEVLESMKPERFDKRTLSRKIFGLARKYRYLTLAPQAVSMNGFLMGVRG